MAAGCASSTQEGTAGAEGLFPALGSTGGQGHPCGLAVTSAAHSAPKTSDCCVTSNTNWNTPVWVLIALLCILSFLAEPGQQNLGETDALGRGTGHVESIHASPLCSAAIHTAIRVKILPRLHPYHQGWVSGAEHEACRRSCPRWKCNFPIISLFS